MPMETYGGAYHWGRHLISVDHDETHSEQTPQRRGDSSTPRFQYGSETPILLKRSACTDSRKGHTMDPTPVSLPLAELAKLALTTGLVAVAVGPFINWWIDRQKSKRAAVAEATHLAARLAVILEEFAIKCAQQIADNSLHSQSDGYAGWAYAALPKLGDFPSELNWATLDSKLLSRSLALQNELEIGESAISFWWEVDPDPALVRNACDGRAGTIGYRAWQIAKELRRTYGLGEFVPTDFSWDTVRTLKKYHDREIERVKEHQRNQDSP